MGCTSSVPTKIYSIGKKKKLNIPQVVVFIPKLRIPVEFDIRKSLKGLVPRDLLDRLFSLRSRIILIAEDTGGSAFHELQRALEDYLPVLLGLTKKEFGLEGMVEFKWKNLLDGRQECCLTSSWFEVLSVVHMMAVLLLSEANALLINPTSTGEGSETSIPEESKKDAIELLIKASGYLEFCVRCILAPLPQEIKSRLPKDMQEGILEALSIQALGQGTELQLGLAVESIKATLSVKRRLACEQLAYYAQAHFCLSASNLSEQYGKKHLSFIRWKYLEAKAAAYYYHGLILDKGKDPSSHVIAACCFLAADELLTNSRKACLGFCIAKPVTRAPPVWGIMKHLHHKIPDIASRKSQMYGYLLEEEKALQSLPDLPDFQLSLRPDDFNMPEIDPAWECEKWEPEVHTLKEHLKDGEHESQA
ncbi:BRO1 domain-containing protein BROX homolog [Papaver somniferum]|uniref:BRO1 domain-containing protein BROX homolog n=1 Tax=Papaver somniferum TaxID=3469 RepID=UPI000E6FAF9A|nr:BRO1 domain-containing protein BROX homolog [Papaver somniferum]